jgi:Tfp pilus assembly PilM family ATPase
MDFSRKKTVAVKTSDQGRRLTNLLGLDFATSGVKAVRLKKTKGQVQMVAADVLPPIGFNANSRPEIPRALASYYTALCATTEEAVLRVFSHALPEGEVESLPTIVRNGLNVPEGVRVGGQIISRGRGKRDSSLLGVAVPEATIKYFLSLFAGGAPAPHSFEIAGLAAFSAFFHNRGEHTVNRTICLIETGARFTYVAFFHRNQLQVINRFSIGGADLRRQVQTTLDVNEEMATEILDGGSIDVSGPVRQALAPFVKQLSVYREFVERRNKCSLDGIYLSGGEATSPCWQAAVSGVLGMPAEAWNPFEKLEVMPDAFPEQLAGQESRFAAAVGAALAGLGDS